MKRSAREAGQERPGPDAVLSVGLGGRPRARSESAALAEELLEQCPPDLRGWEWHYLKRLPFAGVLEASP